MQYSVKSKLIDSFNYDESSKKLSILMSNGARREFIDVPAYVVDDLNSAKSPGSYYFKIIKAKFKQT